MRDTPFPCSKCGACCHFIGMVGVLMELNRGDGVCRHLTADNLCAIYATRPDVCNIETQWAWWKAEYSREQFVEMNKETCEKLRKLVGMKEKENETIPTVGVLPDPEGGTPSVVVGREPGP